MDERGVKEERKREVGIRIQKGYVGKFLELPFFVQLCLCKYIFF
jgi:hypothetical protein